jgi:RES domain-containing protein
VTYPAQDIACPDPGSCVVAKALPTLTTVPLESGRTLYRVYDGKYGYDQHNPGFGDTRFAPIDDPATGKRLSNMYLGETPATVLLESIFHDVHKAGSMVIYQKDLVGKLLAHMTVPDDATLGDLRDPALDKLGLTRSQVASSPAEHYPCTRKLAIAALGQSHTPPLQGLIWHSRQAELAKAPAQEVIVLFGERYKTTVGSWKLVAPGLENLYAGPGRVRVDEIATDLKATIETGAG